MGKAKRDNLTIASIFWVSVLVVATIYLLSAPRPAAGAQIQYRPECVNCHNTSALRDALQTINCAAAACHPTSTAMQKSGSHQTHFGTGKGPGIALCDTCHGIGASQGQHNGHMNGLRNFADGATKTLSTTAVCGNCHSAGGAFNGVNTTANSVGAKDNWKTGVYQNASTLKPGKERWCLGCHDDQPSTINGNTAPKVAGDDVNYGFFKSGHGLPASSKYDRDAVGDAAGNPGAGKNCTDCHDISLTHLNGDDSDLAGQRLKNTINTISVTTVMEVCKACHGTNLGSPATNQVSTHGNDESEGYSRIEAPFAVNCQQCHEPHGNNLNSENNRNLKMIRRDVRIASGVSGDVVFTRTTGTNSFDESDTVDTDDSDDICATCHRNPSNPGNPMTRHIGGRHDNGMGSDERGNRCTACHEHDFRADGEVTADDGFMPSCNACHGYPPVPPGIETSGTTYKTEDYPLGGGAHLVHVIDNSFGCSTCHGHNGSGPEHGGSVGRTVVEQQNVSFDFDDGVSWPGGTTMNNGGNATETFEPSVGPKCWVGCHNPIPFYPENETPNLLNQAVWNDETATPGANVPCKYCHDSQGTAMAEGTLSGVTYLSAHNINTTIRDDCLVCHDNSTHKQGTVRVKNNDTGAVIIWDPGNPTVLQLLCLSCHDADGNQPFSTPTVPPNIEDWWETTASPAPAHKSGGSTNSGYSCFGNGAFGGTGCHGNPHGSAKRKLLAPANVYTAGGDEESFCWNCHNPSTMPGKPGKISSFWDSYSTGFATFSPSSNIVTGTGTSWNSSMAGWYIKKTTDSDTAYTKISAVNSATQVTLERNYRGTPGTSVSYLMRHSQSLHPLEQTSGAHATTEGGQTSWTGSTRHIECMDCHNPHVAEKTTVGGDTGINGPNRGVWGVYVPELDANQNPPTFNKTTQPTLEYQICFKCHSSYTDNRPNSTAYTNADGSARIQGDKALEFNTKNSAYHPVKRQGRNDSANLNAQLTAAGLSTTSAIKCTDCHNNSAIGDAGISGRSSNYAGTEPQGPHGSKNIYNLRANYNRDFSYPRGGYNSNDYQLCFSCHNETKLTAATFGSGANQAQTNFWGGPAAENQHRLHLYSAGSRCSDCHYNVHSNQETNNTQYRINLVVYSAPPENVPTRLVNFAPHVLKYGTRAKPEWWYSTVTKVRRCYLVCHTSSGSNLTMNGYSYKPPSGDLTDAPPP